jgi:exopolysaccharide biosynthesis polyprenyl glycosylphosphotransferase
VSKVSGLYDQDELLVRKTTIHEIPALFNHATLFAFLAWLFSAALFNGSFHATEALTLWAALFFLDVLFRRIARFIACEASPTERLLFIGDASTYLRLVDKLEIGEVNAELVGRVSLLRTSPRSSEEREIEDSTLRSMIDNLDVHRLLIAPSQANPEATMELVRTAKSLKIRVSIVPRVMDVLGNAVVFDDILGVTLLGVRPFDLSRSSRAIKRGMDVIGSGIGLILLAPVFAVIAVAVKIDSPGPVFFRQARVGRDGDVLMILKFRSMVADAEQRKAELIEAGLRDGLFKMEDDPRATRVGRFLRSSSLDELPQLINVMRGEMSLVGPRPLIASEDEAIKGFDRERLRLTPGMTGQWQLMGARVPLSEMVKLDYLYVTGWSLMEDIGILLRTVRHVARRRGV